MKILLLMQVSLESVVLCESQLHQDHRTLKPPEPFRLPQSWAVLPTEEQAMDPGSSMGTQVILSKFTNQIKHSPLSTESAGIA